MVARLLSEGVGKTLPTLYFGLVGLLVNIPVNYVLMHGHLGFPALGAVGCGLRARWSQPGRLTFRRGMPSSVAPAL